ncbi:MAG: hypothetical protein MJ056_08930 [Akkermansia sp.]|nr:hypothetical protein [Akkermansia sp.]
MLLRPAVLWLSAVLPLSAETYTFYVQQGTPSPRYEKQMELVQKAAPAANCEQRQLEDKSATLEDAESAAEAIRNGAVQLPCVVVSDAQGAYAALPLDKLDEAAIAKAREAAQSPTRKQEQEKRDFDADCYLMFARLPCRSRLPNACAPTLRTAASSWTAPWTTRRRGRSWGCARSTRC